MNTEGNLSLNRAEDSEVVQLNDPPEDDEQSFGDLGEDNAVMAEEAGQRIVIDEDTMESNDLLLSSSDPAATKQPPSPIAPQEALPSAPLPAPCKPSSSDSSFYKGLVRKLEESSYNDQTLQPSYLDFEAAERRYLEQVKILYCHFLIGDKPLGRAQFQQLRALLFVPNYGQSLVKWANQKYGHTLTLPLALERLDLMEKAALEPKRRCYDEVRLLVMLAVLLVIIKLLS